MGWTWALATSTRFIVHASLALTRAVDRPSVNAGAVDLFRGGRAAADAANAARAEASERGHGLGRGAGRRVVQLCTAVRQRRRRSGDLLELAQLLWSCGRYLIWYSRVLAWWRILFGRVCRGGRTFREGPICTNSRPLYQAAENHANKENSHAFVRLASVAPPGSSGCRSVAGL